MTSSGCVVCLATACSSSREAVGASVVFASASIDGGLLESWDGGKSALSELVGESDCEGPSVGSSEVDGNGVIVGDGEVVELRLG